MPLVRRAPSHADQVAGLEGEAAPRFANRVAALDSSHETARTLQELRLRRGPADQVVALHPVDPQDGKVGAVPQRCLEIAAPPRIAQAGELCGLGGQVDVQDAGQGVHEHSHPDQAYEVRDRVARGEVRGGLFDWERVGEIGHPGREGILGRDQCRGAGQRAGQQSGRVARRQAEHVSQERGESHRRERHEERQEQILSALLAEGAEELRSGLKSHTVDEEDEAQRERVGRDGDLEVAEDECTEQHARGGPEFEAEEFEVADEIARAENEEQRDYGLIGERVDQYRHLRFAAGVYQLARRVEDRG